ncbi:hypothetical protein D0420_05585 [Staphylococcus saprophyticus]|nr:hypothetical protein [Staphylococcus saprophyticus]
MSQNKYQLKLDEIDKVLKDNGVDNENLAVALSELFSLYTDDERLKRSVISDIDRVNKDMSQEAQMRRQGIFPEDLSKD